MADTIKIPGIGPTDKKWVFAGGALVAGIVGYAYWNRSRVADTEIADYTELDYAQDGGVDEYVNPGGSQDPVVVDNNPAPTTNAEWSLQAGEYLTDTGYEPITVAAALGAYFARMKLSQLHAEIIRAAHGRFGPPPVGTYPIEVTPTPTTPTPTLPKLTAPTGLSAHDIGSTTVGLIWNAVTGARWYSVYHSGRSTPYNTASTHITITGLKRNTPYKVQVRAIGMDKKPGPLSASRSFRTKK